MKFVKKINMGLILTIIAVIAVIIYSVNLENTRNSAKGDIKKSCEEFISTTSKYYTLPENYQIIGAQSKDIDLTELYSEMENELKQETANENFAKIYKSILTEYIKEQLVDTTKITTSFNREITKISKYTFDGNQVTVTFDSKVTTKQKYNEVNQETGEQSEKIKDNTFEITDETITLEKIGESWKIVSADLQYYDVNSSEYYYSI